MNPTLLVVAAALAVVVNGQSECQCGGFIKQGKYSEWFYSFLNFFHESCDDMDGCKRDCQIYISNLTHNGDLTTIIKSEGMSVGDLICKKLNHDVPTNTRVEFDYQLCVSDWYDTGIKTTYPFCCIDGDFPESGCPAQ